MRVRGVRRIPLTALTFLLSALILTGLALAARRAAATDPAALQRKLESIAREKERARNNLRYVKARHGRVTRELAQIEGNLDRGEARLSEVRLDVHQARTRLAQAVSEYRRSEARLDGHRADVSDRLVAIYELGDVQPLEVLLQSTSFTDFANRLYLLNLVVEQDAQLMGEFERAREEADQHRATIAVQERSLSHLQGQVTAEARRLARWRDQTAAKKARLLADRVAYERALAELEQDSREVTAMLQRLQRTPGGRQHAVTPWKGSLSAPVSGPVTSGFGYRNHPILGGRRMHTGIDISAAAGTPIRAAAGGVVVFSGRWGGYGNCVIIDHGGSLATLYAHCSTLEVSEGDSVKQGQTIAKVGSTGLSTGPHLHFETRRDGRPVDPGGL